MDGQDAQDGDRLARTPGAWGRGRIGAKAGGRPSGSPGSPARCPGPSHRGARDVAAPAAVRSYLITSLKGVLVACSKSGISVLVISEIRFGAPGFLAVLPLC